MPERKACDPKLKRIATVSATKFITVSVHTEEY